MKHSNKNRKIISNKYSPILILICVNLIIGALIITDYGESWDEHLRYGYGEESLNAYRGIKSDLTDEKEPFFVMLAIAGSNFLQNFCGDCFIGDLRHYINFMSFLLGLFFLYRLSCRYVGKWAALGGVLLFNTQPLLWGHAFINPKDIPFMAFFVASVDIGLSMAETWNGKFLASATQDNLTNKSQKSHLINDWQQTPVKNRRFLVVLCLTGVIFILGLFISQRFMQKTIENLIWDVYYQNSLEILNTIFERTAENLHDISVEKYIQKSWALYTKTILYISIATIGAFIIGALVLFTDTRRALWQNQILPFTKAIWINFKNPKVISAGIALGFACSIRTLGPASGFLVGFYLLVKGKFRALPIIIAYILIGALTTYIFWPGLWDAPVSNYLDSLLTASDFPWGGKVLFNGTSYNIGTLPRTYLPVLLTLQFTIPTLISMLVGFIFAIILVRKNISSWGKFAVITLWFFAPIGMAIVTQPNMYDNFRHFLFAIPPLFVFASIGIQAIYKFVQRPIFRTLIILILVIPNLYQVIQSHPYQYVYYNAFVGGVDGAFRKFEMDYWGISYREAAEYLNQKAPLNSKVIVYGPIHLIETYARSDLRLIRYSKTLEGNNQEYQYAIILSRYDKDIQLFPNITEKAIIGNQNSVFTVVKLLNRAEGSPP